LSAPARALREVVQQTVLHESGELEGVHPVTDADAAAS
jgi:hypothetical protein